MELFKLFGTISIQNSEAIEALKNTTDNAEQSENKMTSAFKKIGAAVATYFAVDKIKQFGVGCVEAAAEIQAQNSAFEQTFGDLASAATDAFERVSAATGIMASRLKTEGTKAFSMFKGAGMDANDALVETETFMNLAADAAAYYDISLEDASARVLGFAKGNFENGDAIGVFTNEAQRNTIAMEQYGKKYSECTEAQKQMMALDMIQHTYELSGAIGQATREADGYENVMGNLKEAWRKFQAVIGAPILQAVIPILKKVTAGLAAMGEKSQEAGMWMQKHEGVVKVVTTGLIALTSAVVAYKTAMAISAVIDLATKSLQGMSVAQAALNAVMNLNPIGVVVAAIAALIVIGVALYKKWDTVKAKATELWQKTTEIFENIKKSISEKVESIKTSLEEKWDSIKNSVSEKIEEIKTAAIDKWDEIKNAVIEKMNAAKETIINIFTAVKDGLISIWETIKNVVQVAIMFIAELLNAAFQAIMMPWRFIWENCKEYIIAAWDAIKAGVSTALNNISTVIQNAWNLIVTILSPIVQKTIYVVSTAWNTLKETIITIMTAIGSAVSTIMSAIKTAIIAVWNSIKNGIIVVLNAISSVVSTAWTGIKTTVTTIINAIRNVIVNVFNAVKNFIINVLNGIKSAFTSAWNAVKTTVSNAINSVKSAISSGLNSAKSTVSGVLESIKSKFSSIFESAKKIVSNAIEKIKSFFNFSWKLPKLKMPHPKITGEFSLNPPSAPHFDIEWYKKAMNEPRILTEPTIFGMNASGQPMAGGEAGDEIVSGKNTLLNMIRTIVAGENGNMNDTLLRILDLLMEYLPQLNDMKLMLDTGVMVGALSPAMTQVVENNINMKMTDYTKWGGK